MIKVFKIGGNVIEDPVMLDKFCRDYSAVAGGKVLIHGGGAFASELQTRLGQTPVKIEGRRVTDEDTLQAVTMAYAGWCNKMLVSTLQKYGCDAIGLAGCDANVVCARRRPPRMLMDGKTVVDYGFVGDVNPGSVNTKFLEALLEMGLSPVLCAINHDGKGQLLNTNADTMASSVAAALEAQLVCCFELDGVLSDINNPASLIPYISSSDFETLKSSGQIAGGMIPKIENCLMALRCGAVEAIIKNAGDINGNKGTRIVL